MVVSEVASATTHKRKVTMEAIATGGLIVLIFAVALVLLIAAGIVWLVSRAWMKVARADEALVISGKSQKTESGEESPVTVIVNGKALVNPISQRHEVISLRSRQLAMRAEAQSLDNVTLRVEAVALVKIGSGVASVRAAAERFASQDDAVENFTQDQLEGALRGVIATLSVVDLMRERQKLSDQIKTDVSVELERQGLVLDSFQIKGITDDSGYIASLGIPEIESKRQAAEIAQANAERAIAKTRISTQEQDLVEQTALDKNRAASNAEVGKARAEAEQAEDLAREKARQQVLEQAAANKQAQLDADVKRVADAELYRREKEAEAKAMERTRDAEAKEFERTRSAEAEAFERTRQADVSALERTRAATASAEVAAREAEATRLRSEADAAALLADGDAKAQVIAKEAEALAANQEALLAQRAIELLPQLVAEFAKGYATIGEVTVISGGEGGGLGNSFAGEQATALASAFESIKATTGIDMAAVIAGRATGQAIGEGLKESGSA